MKPARRRAIACSAVLALSTSWVVGLPGISQADGGSPTPGTPDSGFGASGTASLPTPSGAGQVNPLDRVVVGPKGSIYVGGIATGYDSNQNHIVVYKLNPGGSLDTNFGDSDSGNSGAATQLGYFVDPQPTVDASVAGFAVDSSGDVFVGGGRTTDGPDEIFVERFSSSGVQDTNFGSNGIARLSENEYGSDDTVTDMAVDGSGNVVVSAAIGGGDGGDRNFQVARFTPTGQLDPTFGDGPTGNQSGWTTTDFGSPAQASSDMPEQLVIQPDGKIVVAGEGDAGASVVALARYTTAGLPDASFGNAGKVQSGLGFGSPDLSVSSVALGTDGVISVGGTNNGNGPTGFVARFTTAGAVEGSFNSAKSDSGYAGSYEVPLRYETTTTGYPGSVSDIAIDPAGRILVSGGSRLGETSSEADVARLVDAAYPTDRTWAGNGLAPLPCQASNAAGGGITATAAGQVVVTSACGGDLQVNQLRGGNDIPIAGNTSQGDGSDLDITVNNVSVNGGGYAATVAPGESFTVGMSYSVHQSSTYCPGCIDQIQVGYANDAPQQCAFDGGPGGGNTVTGTANLTFVAPTTPGIYYIAAEGNQLFYCNQQGWSANQEPPQSSFIAKVQVGGVTSLAITSDKTTVAAGHFTTPQSAVPGSALQAAGLALQSAPLRTAPLRTAPLRTAPLRTAGLASAPLRTAPLRTAPLRTAPLRTAAVNIPLSQLQLYPPKTWSDVLSGTPLANQPVQNVTLSDVLALNLPASTLSVGDINWAASPAGGVSIAAFLLGNTPLSALPSPSGGDWCNYLSGKPLACGGDSTFPGTHTLADVQLGGDDVSSYLSSTAIPLNGANGIPLNNTSLASMNLDSLALDQTPLRDVPAGSYASCSSCTFGQASQGESYDSSGNLTGPLTAAGPKTLGTLLGDGSAGLPNLTLGDLLPGIIPVDEQPDDLLPTSAVADASPYPTGNSSVVTYKATAGLTCPASGAGSLHISLTLPPGFRRLPGSEQLSIAGTSVANPTVTDSVIQGNGSSGDRKALDVAGPFTCAAGSTTAVLSVKAEAGTGLIGPLTVDGSASLNNGMPLSAVAQAPVTVVDTASQTSASSNTIYLGHISAPGDIDTYSIDPTAANLLPGSQITVSLTNIPNGQDDDLVLYGPAGPTLRSAPLRTAPLRTAPLRTAPTDQTGDPTADSSTAPPDVQSDIPLNPPSGQVYRDSSVNRGNHSESIVTTVGEGETGGYTVQVSGYDGSFSPQPYMLRISVSPPATPLGCAALNKPFAGQGTAGSLPATPLPTSTQTLILVNKQRLGDFYGSTGATNVMTALNTLAGRSDVQGVVLPVEGDSAVASAYSAWDNSPCSPVAADNVVAAINNLVDRYRTGLTGLRNVVIVGDDQIIPMARVADHAAVENENEYAGAAAFNGQDNAESRALSQGYMLTDDAYGSFAPIPWLESAFYVPNVALGRLVETPGDIVGAVNAYVSAGGVRTPSAGFTTGYDFMTGEAQSIDAALRQNLPKITGVAGAAPVTNQISSTWTRTDAITGLGSGTNRLISLNAHYDNYRALPANEFSSGTQNQLLTTKDTDLPSSFLGSVLFTIGCHSGLNLADTFVASPTAAQSAKLDDWPQEISHRGGELVGNTGFGYGDSDSIAYSAAIMSKFAQNLDGSMTVGQALMYAKQSYLHLPLGVYDAKASEEATFYGLPMYRLGANGKVAASAVPAPVTTGTPVTTVSGTPQAASFDGSNGVSLKVNNGSDGTYYTVHHNAGNSDDTPLVLQNEPIEPQTTVNLAPRTDGLTAHGVSLDSLSTYVTSSSGSFNPVFDKPTADLSKFSPEPQISNAFFPATLDGLISGQTPSGPQDTVVLTPGEFRSTGNNAGFQLLASNMGFHVNYSNSANFTPPTILSTNAVVGSGGNRLYFTVTTSSPDPGGVQGVTVLYLPNPSTAPTAWQKVSLSPSSDGNTWTASVAYSGPSTVGQYIVQATDASGNVAESANKGQDYQATQAPASSPNGPAIAFSGTPQGGIYTANPTVTLTGQAPLSYSVDNANFAPYDSGNKPAITGDGNHVITAKDALGNTSTAIVTISTSNPQVTIDAPAQGATYKWNQQPTPTYSCTSLAGIASCAVTSGSPVVGSNTFSVKATDSLGRTATKSMTYSLTAQFAFGGFASPLPANGGSPSAPVAGNAPQTIPVKFSLTDTANNNALVTNPNAIKSIQQSTPYACSSAPPTAASAYSTATSDGSGLQVDNGSGFHFNWKSQKAWTGSCVRLVFTFADTSTASVYAKFS